MRTNTGIMCANCKDYHPTIADVRNCCMGLSPASGTADDDAMEQHYQEQAELAAEQRYERWLEDGGEHADRIQAEAQHDQAMEADWSDFYLPAPAAPEGNAATDKQRDYIRILAAERGVDEPAYTTKREASDVIGRLLKMPKQQSASVAQHSDEETDVPEGRYAIVVDGQTKFYKVDRPSEGRWAGRVFVSALASDTKHPIRSYSLRNEILRLIAVDPKAAMLLYGREIGSCGHCGRTLTNEESRKLGIGPICREALGWS